MDSELPSANLLVQLPIAALINSAEGLLETLIVERLSYPRRVKISHSSKTKVYADVGFLDRPDLRLQVVAGERGGQQLTCRFR